MTNRKSNTRFRLVPKSTTLDDLEGPLRTVVQNTCAFPSLPRKSMKIDPYYQRRRCSTMTLDSDNKVYADIGWGSLERERLTTVG